jgi:catechol 2,3-dioxygenase-like lactoylglutathione lyase family enzyme
MISHIHAATVVVADQDKALDFYVNTLGWQKADDEMVGEDMRWLTVVPPGAPTQLALAHTSWFCDERPGPNKMTGLSLVAPDIDAAYEALTARGVRFKHPVEMMPWGMKATWFYDPDGNEFFLVGGSGEGVAS